MKQTARIKIHNLVAGPTVSVIPAFRMAPFYPAADLERKNLARYLEPCVAPLIAARCSFVEIVWSIRGVLLKAARGEEIIACCLSEEDAHTMKIEPAFAAPWYLES